MFRSERDELAENGRIMKNSETYTCRTVNARLWWAGYVAHIRGTRSAFRILVKTLFKNGHLEIQEGDGKTIR
jgi:hypothetical protein